MTSNESHSGQDGRGRRHHASPSGADQDKMEQIQQQYRRFLALVVVAMFMDIVTLAFLTLSLVIAAKYFPSVPEKAAAIWKVLGVLVLVLSVAAKVIISRCGSPILPPRSAANFSSIVRQQGRNSHRLIVWFDIRLIFRSLCLSLIAFILAERATARRALDLPAAVLFLISAGIIALNLFKARAQMSTADESLLGAVRLQIVQTSYRIQFARNIWYFIIPFCAGVMLLSQNVPIFKDAGPILASVVSPSIALAIGLLAVALSLLVAAIVLRAQFRFIRGRQNHARERLGQLEKLLAELSEESNRGEALSS
jgi:hypothetical protein